MGAYQKNIKFFKSGDPNKIKFQLKISMAESKPNDKTSLANGGGLRCTLVFQSRRPDTLPFSP